MVWIEYLNFLKKKSFKLQTIFSCKFSWWLQWWSMLHCLQKVESMIHPMKIHWDGSTTLLCPKLSWTVALFQCDPIPKEALKGFWVLLSVVQQCSEQCDFILISMLKTSFQGNLPYRYEDLGLLFLKNAGFYPRKNGANTDNSQWWRNKYSFQWNILPNTYPIKTRYVVKNFIILDCQMFPYINSLKINHVYTWLWFCVKFDSLLNWIWKIKFAKNVLFAPSTSNWDQNVQNTELRYSKWNEILKFNT